MIKKIGLAILCVTMVACTPNIKTYALECEQVGYGVGSKNYKRCIEDSVRQCKSSFMGFACR